MQRFKSAIIVEDHPELGAELRDTVLTFCDEVCWHTTLAGARAAIVAGVDLALIDVVLPDGRGTELASLLLALRPMPFVVAMSGIADSSEALALSIAGVHAFIPKPIKVNELGEMLAALHANPAPLRSMGAMQVGATSLQDAQRELRRAMLIQALSQAAGSRSSAAKLLGISRQAVQHMIRDFVAFEGLPAELLSERRGS